MLRDLSIVRGWPDTVAAFRQWHRDGWRIFVPWVAVSFAIACLLLALTLLIGSIVEPDPSRRIGLSLAYARPPVLPIFFGNMLVLLLHALACFAGYITHVSVPRAQVSRFAWLNAATRHLGEIAVVFIPAVTIFSISTQAWVLGDRASTLAYHLGMPVWLVMATVLPHALPELTAVFLPLAAWLVASRTRAWHQLIAATLCTSLVAAPVIYASALVEMQYWPGNVRRAIDTRPWADWKHIGNVRRLEDGRATGPMRFLQARARVSDRAYPTLDEAMRAEGRRTEAQDVGAVAIYAEANGFVAYELWSHTNWGYRLVPPHYYDQPVRHELTESLVIQLEQESDTPEPAVLLDGDVRYLEGDLRPSSSDAS